MTMTYSFWEVLNRNWLLQRYLLLGACLVVLFVGDGNGQTKPSPCPTAFRYLPNTSRDKNRWYGELTVVSDVDIIDGVFLAMLFDGPSLQLAVSPQHNNKFIQKNILTCSSRLLAKRSSKERWLSTWWGTWGTSWRQTNPWRCNFISTTRITKNLQTS